MKIRRWLRGCKLRQLKKWYKGKIPNSGYYYTPEEYDNLISKFKKLKLGDMIYNPYNFIIEPIKEICSYWEDEHMGRFRILKFEVVTESDCIIYNLIEKPSLEIIDKQKKIMDIFNNT